MISMGIKDQLSRYTNTKLKLILVNLFPSLAYLRTEILNIAVDIKHGIRVRHRLRVMFIL